MSSTNFGSRGPCGVRGYTTMVVGTPRRFSALYISYPCDVGTRMSASPCRIISGVVTFFSGHIPPAGAAITAGFLFDVPVRFDTDYLEVDLSAFAAGAIPKIPLVEIRV